jgi:nitrate reductase gamma subunit
MSVDIWTRLIFPWAVGVFLIALTFRLVRILRYPFRKDLSQPRGDARRGMVYALTFAMLPWKKESTRLHWVTYTAGMGMHVGVLVVFLYALARRLGWGVTLWESVVAVIGPVALLLGVGLFLKRLFVPYMRAISTPDDFISNLLVNGYLLGGTLTAYHGEWVTFWRLAAILLLVWIPVGKIFHMLLFFISRILFGGHFGRRGVIKHGAPITY